MVSLSLRGRIRAAFGLVLVVAAATALLAARRHDSLLLVLAATMVVLGTVSVAALFQAANEWRARERELEVVVEQLEMAMASIRTLSGLLPICSCCKKIRDDSGYWDRVESYISRRTDAQFSHGVCPECFVKLYPDIPLPEPAAT